MLAHRHGEYTPTLTLNPVRVADDNPKRLWMTIQNIGAAGGIISVRLGDNPDQICAVLPNQYDSYQITKDNPWHGKVFVDANIDAANLIYVMEVSEV